MEFVKLFEMKPIGTNESTLVFREDSIEVYSPDNPPWGIGLAFLVFLASFALIIILPLLFLAPYLLTQGEAIANAESLAEFATNDKTALILQIASVIPAHILTLIVAWLVVTKWKTYSFTKMLGWKWGGFRWWHAVLLLVSVFALAATTTTVFGEQDNELMRILRSSRTIVYIIALMATFSAPIVEEVVYRGVLYSALQRAFNIPMAVIFVTLIFAGIHFPQYWGDYSTLISITFLSLIITLIRVKTGNLLPCIAFHFVINGLQSVLLVLEPYLPKSLGVLKEAETAAMVVFSNF